MMPGQDGGHHSLDDEQLDMTEIQEMSLLDQIKDEIEFQLTPLEPELAENIQEKLNAISSWNDGQFEDESPSLDSWAKAANRPQLSTLLENLINEVLQNQLETLVNESREEALTLRSTLKTNLTELSSSIELNLRSAGNEQKELYAKIAACSNYLASLNEDTDKQKIEETLAQYKQLAQNPFILPEIKRSMISIANSVEGTLIENRENIPQQRNQTFKAIQQLNFSAILDEEIPKERWAENAAVALRSPHFNYDEAIRNLDIARDAARGITSRYVTKEESGLAMDTYVSDTRKAVPFSEQQDTFENWASMGLSYYRFAERLIDLEYNKTQLEIQRLETISDSRDPELQELQIQLETLDNARNEIRQKAQTFLAEIQNAPSKPAAHQYLVNHVNTDLAPYLWNKLNEVDSKFVREIQKKNVKNNAQAKQAMRLAKGEEPEETVTGTLVNQMGKMRDFGSLKREPFASVTIAKAINSDAVSDKYTLRVDVPLYHLTPTQQKAIIAIKNCNGDLTAPGLPEWFTKQKSAMARELIMSYADDILQGRDIPTQMLNYIPILRNTAEVRSYSNNNADSELRELYQNFRSGNLGNEVKAGDAAIKETAEQFAYNTGAKTVVAHSLLSAGTDMYSVSRNRVGVDVNEGQLFSNTDRAIHELDSRSAATGVKYVIGNTSVNNTQNSEYASDRNTASIDAISQEANGVIDHTRALPPDVASDSELQRLVILLKWTQEDYIGLLNNDLSLYDHQMTGEENKNARLTAHFLQMGSLVRQYRERIEHLRKAHPEIEISEVNDVASTAFCKSGKDRTAVVNTIALAETEARDALLPQKDNWRFKQAYENVIRSGSVQHLILRNPTDKIRYHMAVQESIVNQINSEHSARIAANQSTGAGGIKDSEHSTPEWFMSKFYDVKFVNTREQLFHNDLNTIYVHKTPDGKYRYAMAGGLHGDGKLLLPDERSINSPDKISDDEHLQILTQVYHDGHTLFVNDEDLKRQWITEEAKNNSKLKGPTEAAVTAVAPSPPPAAAVEDTQSRTTSNDTLWGRGWAYITNPFKSTPSPSASRTASSDSKESKTSTNSIPLSASRDPSPSYEESTAMITRKMMSLHALNAAELEDLKNHIQQLHVQTPDENTKMELLGHITKIDNHIRERQSIPVSSMNALRNAEDENTTSAPRMEMGEH